MTSGPLNPAAKGNFAFKEAVLNGHQEVVTLLLQDVRVDPKSENFAAFRSIRNREDRIEILRMLLSNDKASPVCASTGILP